MSPTIDTLIELQVTDYNMICSFAGNGNNCLIYNFFEETFMVDYYVISQGLTDKPYTFDYYGQTANFVVESIITGDVSGVKAIILEDNDEGFFGTLTLPKISNNYLNNKLITDEYNSSALTNGTASGLILIEGIITTNGSDWTIEMNP